RVRKATKGISQGFSLMKASRVAVFLPMKRGSSKLAKDKKRPRTPSTIFNWRHKFAELNPTDSFVLPSPSANPNLVKVGMRKLPVIAAPPANHMIDKKTLRPNSLVCR